MRCPPAGTPAGTLLHVLSVEPRPAPSDRLTCSLVDLDCPVPDVLLQVEAVGRRGTMERVRLGEIPRHAVGTCWGRDVAARAGDPVGLARVRHLVDQLLETALDLRGV